MLGRLLQSLRRRPDGASPPAGAQAAAAADFAAGRFAAARDYYEAAHRRDPDDAEVAYRLGVIYGSNGLPAQAAPLLARAARARPTDVDVLNAQANVAWLQADWARALEFFRGACGLAPRNATLLANFALCLHDAGEFAEAATVVSRALEVDPAHVDALVNAAVVRLDLGDTAGAGECLQRALAIAPDYPEARAMRAQWLLRQARFAEGWREYEFRLHCRDGRYAELPGVPRWDGVADPARRLVVCAEQGLGDQIMFASCLPEVLARMPDCDLECDPRLVRLFARSFPAARVHAQSPALQRPWAGTSTGSWRQVHLGSLPVLLRTDAASFPAHGGYLCADAVRVEHWRARLAALGPGLRIGLAWRGGVPRTRQALRSISLTQLPPILRTPGACFVSLQHGPCDDDYRALAACSDARIAHWQEAIDDFDETAALVAALDAVVCVCGTAVHLAGALGTPALVLVPSCPEWRYLSAGDTMPWYPSVRLFRQRTPGDWQGAIAAVAAELARLAAPA